MSEWLQHALAPLNVAPTGVVVIVDPDRVVDPARVIGDVVEVGDWWGLRAAYERLGRRRPPDGGRLVLLARAELGGAPLPWDIEQASGATVTVRLPGPPEVRAVLARLEEDEAEGAIAVAAAGGDLAAVMGALAGVMVSTPLPRADQLRLAARLAVRAVPSPPLNALARRWVTEPALSGLLDIPAAAAGLQREWLLFTREGDQQWANDFEAARIELGELFASGLLTRVTTGSAVPMWASVGLRSPTSEERAEELLAQPRATVPPDDQAGWVATAEWWGDVRRLVAAAPMELRERAWRVWAELDEAFLPWLRARYGAQLSSAARWPPALHRVAHHLGRRLREGAVERVLLVVLDGMGHAQWAHLRERLSLDVVEAGSTFALVPTYTTVSRQAIFAADLPVTYPESLWSTQPERRRWQAFWAAQGLAVTGAAYHRVRGRFPHDHIDFGAARAVGVVVNAVDDLMHTSELLGDAQLLANLDVWAANGFLDDLVRRAVDEGFEVWITADHGNLECLPAGALSEGVAIESAGKRLLRYPNRVLRDASAAEGIVWDEIPGMPGSAEPLLFAPGRTAFTNNQISISHGALSLDEVIVPLARVSA